VDPSRCAVAVQDTSDGYQPLAWAYRTHTTGYLQRLDVIGEIIASGTPRSRALAGDVRQMVSTGTQMGNRSTVLSLYVVCFR
jgi:hypothetical protein